MTLGLSRPLARPRLERCARDILPFGRPDFPGTFLDLKIGGPAPSPEAAAALRKRAVECCQASLLQWGESGGRVTWIDYQRKVLRLPGR
jgi:hypothetical protein